MHPRCVCCVRLDETSQQNFVLLFYNRMLMPSGWLEKLANNHSSNWVCFSNGTRFAPINGQRTWVGAMPQHGTRVIHKASALCQSTEHVWFTRPQHYVTARDTCGSRQGLSIMSQRGTRVIHKAWALCHNTEHVWFTRHQHYITTRDTCDSQGLSTMSQHGTRVIHKALALCRNTGHVWFIRP